MSNATPKPSISSERDVHAAAKAAVKANQVKERKLAEQVAKSGGYPPAHGRAFTAATNPLLPVTEVEERRRLMTVLVAACPTRGGAIGATAKLLFDARRCPTFLDALELSAELLSVETDATCEAIAALARDGWEGGLGSLLAAARSL